jgi:hypothetical protein
MQTWPDRGEICGESHSIERHDWPRAKRPPAMRHKSRFPIYPRLGRTTNRRLPTMHPMRWDAMARARMGAPAHAKFPTCPVRVVSHFTYLKCELKCVGASGSEWRCSLPIVAVAV